MGSPPFAMSHKSPRLNEKPTLRIDPLLIGIALAKQHVGDVLLGEAESALTFDQCYNIVSNRHDGEPALPDCGERREWVGWPQN
jgi:hypothetical protein